MGDELGLEDPTQNKIVGELLARSLSVYQTYQQILRTNGVVGDLSQYYIREKSIEQRRARFNSDSFHWSQLFLARWVAFYGERPLRILVWSLIVIVGFAGAYAAGGAGPATASDPLETLGGTLFTSFNVFLGGAEVTSPSVGMQILATAETVFGGILAALFIAVLTRYMRAG